VRAAGAGVMRLIRGGVLARGLGCSGFSFGEGEWSGVESRLDTEVVFGFLFLTHALDPPSSTQPR